MTQQFDPYEPLAEHLADTGPIRRVQEIAPWRRTVGFISLIGAAALTIATALLVLKSTPAPPVPNRAEPTNAPATVESIVQTTTTPPTNLTSQTDPVLPNNGQPVDPSMIAQLLSTPMRVVNQTVGLEIPRDDFSAFTIIPDRPRNEVIQYTIQAGDTIFGVAERYGLKPETIAWSNDRAITEGLRPGKTLNILPVDGVYFTVSADATIDSIARQYHVDPYVVIDSEYNNLFGDTPDTKLPSGTHVVLPGGTAEQIAWTPPVQHVPSTSGGGNGSRGERISFDVGDPGSCGLVNNAGAGGGWLKPLASYTWVRGFSSIHFGVDLSATQGTPIMAATGGTVMFAGWSNWGYGYSVVIASGPFSEIYGHMSAYYAKCGTVVSAGQVIGVVGHTGEATGDHLHFEIRYNDVPTDPTGIMPF